MPRVLIIEDQKRLLASLRRGLEEEGYDVLTSASGEDGYYLATTQAPDVVVLDLMLPKRDGFQVLRDLRSHGFRKPVLILTSRDMVEDRVRGLDSGADDYVVKPVAFAELVARLRALLRRNLPEPEVVLRADNLELDRVGHRVVRSGVELNLSHREYELLEYLLLHKNASVTREMLGRDVWEEPDVMLTNVIDVFINMLRKKVEQPGQKQLIHTVRGVGYSLRGR